MATRTRSHVVAPVVWRRLAFVSIVLVNAAPAFAQANTGSIVGTVRDSSGAVLPGVAVAIRNEATNATR